MDIAEVRKFLSKNDRGVLVARKKNGAPQITLVTSGIDGEGRVTVSARRNTFKVRNIARDPRVSLLVMGEQFHGSRYITVDGTAEIIALPEAMELLLDVYRRRLGDTYDEAEARKKILDQDRVLIRVAIESFGPQSRG